MPLLTLRGCLIEARNTIDQALPLAWRTGTCVLRGFSGGTGDQGDFVRLVEDGDNRRLDAVLVLVGQIAGADLGFDGIVGDRLLDDGDQRKALVEILRGSGLILGLERDAGLVGVAQQAPGGDGDRALLGGGEVRITESNEKIVMKDFSKLVLALSLTLPTAAGLAADTQPAQAGAAPAQTQPVPAAAHLGVQVSPLPPALAVQLPETVPKGQGVLISRVEPGSPAETAGLRPYDLLLSYDDQRLYAPEQLSRLVALDRPGRSVSLELVRSGKVLTVQVALGEARTAPFPGGHSWRSWAPWPFGFSHPVQPMQRAAPEQLQETISERFESLNVEKLEDGRYRAAIEYLDESGEKRSFQLEGTREELRRQIAENKEMDPAARQHLLDALDMKESWRMPRFWGPMDFEGLMRAWRDGEWMQY